MNVFDISTEDDKIIISIERKSIDIRELSKIINQFRTEQLINKANFDEDILQFADEIKKDWWGKNKNEFLELNN